MINFTEVQKDREEKIDKLKKDNMMLTKKTEE